MRLMLTTAACLLAGVTMAAAQADGEVQITVAAFTLAANGAEAPAGVVRGTGRLTMGQPVVGVFSLSGCDGFSVTRPPNSFSEGTDVGWRVEVTPLKVVDHAVTFRLRWIRAIDRSATFERAGHDFEVTLRPGESRPVDTVPIPAGAKTSDGRPCEMKAASLRVSADFPQMDRRLIGADVWLVERLPNGNERSQRQSVRGLPHRAIPFYFDGMAEGDKRLDIFGELVADPGEGSVRIALQTATAQAHPGQSGYQSVHWFRSALNMKPNDIVDVALTRESGKAPSADGRILSIRIQAKQIR